MEVGRRGGGGGGGKWSVAAHNSVPPAAVQKHQSLAAIGFHGTPLQSSSIFFFKLLIGFYLVNLVGHVKMH